MKVAERNWFAVGCAIESLLLVVAAAIAWLADVPLLGDLHWSATDCGVGLLATAPMLALFGWGLGSSSAPLVNIRRSLEALRPLLGRWSVLQLLAISALAGLCEEVLFRAVLQGALTSAAGVWVGLAAASLLFGCAHLITLTYGIAATIIGLYLGGLWLLSGNLLVPVVAHAAYDGIALIYFLRVWRGRPSHTRVRGGG